VAAEGKITPSVALREEYNDNILLAPTNTKDDFITSVIPSINVSYTWRILSLSLDYGLDFRFYAKHPEENLTSPTDTQAAKLDTTLSPYRDIFFVKVSDVYARVPIDTRKQTGINNYVVNLTDSNSFFVSPYVQYPLSGAVKMQLGYSYANVWYKHGDSYYNHDGFGGIIAELSSSVTASINYDYLIHRLTGQEVSSPFQNIMVSDSYDRQTVSFAPAWQVNSLLTLNGSVGETWFHYKDGHKENGPIGSAAVAYKLTNFLSLLAGYDVNYNYSVDSGTYKEEKEHGTISYLGKIPVSVDIFHKIDTYRELNRRDRWQGVNLSSSIPITPKITGRLTGMFEDFKFNEVETENGKRYSLDAAVDYAIKITTLTLGYTYNRNDSSIPSNEYVNNIVYIQARFTI
jgi:uncharacterized protein (PEP-CTERM system associated)